MIVSYWQLSEKVLLKELTTDKQTGLSQYEAKKRLKIYGANVLVGRIKASAWRLLLAQVNSPLIYMLLFAACLSLLLYDKTDAMIIFGIITVSASLSFFQERGAIKTMDKLLQIVRINVDVIRQNEKLEIPIEQVVPGDIILLKAGDCIPADCYVLEAQDLFVDEATLTGESFCAEKKPGVLPEESPISKRTNILFMGTHVVSGMAKAVCVVTGKESEFGKISERLSFRPPETDFERGVSRFGYLLGEVTLILLIIIFACNVFLGRSVVESLLFSLALSVGLTPQLLPAIISVNLAQGAKWMAQKRVIVKRLASIENFGSMNILCADKTGTLTTNDITLDKAIGTMLENSEKVSLYASLNAAFQSGYNNAIDQAILKESRIDIANWKKLAECPYDFVRKKLSVLVQLKDTALLITKGAFSPIKESCTYAETEDGKIVPIASMSHQLSKSYEDFCNQGYRVIAIAYKNAKGMSLLSPADEKEMIFLGFLLFWNPPKENIAETIHTLEKLGIDFKVITGDSKLVALNMAKFLDISNDLVLTGTDIRHMSDEALLYKAHRTTIFAEVEPNQKERIILALKRAGNVVGFLGDGINDVTALHSADVSISVDKAQDAAKDVADIVLLDKDLSVLKDGVMAGRLTFANTLKYIFMSTSANFGNMFSMAGASLFLNFLPLLPKQVLLTNLLTDLPEMTIATDSVDAEMIEKPLRWNVQFIRKFMMIFGLISSIFDYATFCALLWLQATVAEFRTGWFIESVISATLIVLVVRTFRPFFKSMPSRYLLCSVLLIISFCLLLPFTSLAQSLGFTALPGAFYAMLSLIVALYILSVEVAKRLFLQNISSLHTKLLARFSTRRRQKPLFHF